MEIHRVSAYHDVEHALRITDLKQSLYDEGKILMDKVLVTLHGDEHRQRRSIESQLFRKNFFRVYENEVFPGLLSETLDQFLTESSLDLKELGYRLLLQIHDEVILEGPEAHKDEALALVKAHMEKPFNDHENLCDVDLNVDGDYASTWFDAK